MNFLDKITAGVDEAGRGPLAGPVVAAAVILNPEEPIIGLKDSKLLSPQKRGILAEIIKLKALAFGIGRAEIEEIDTLNIFHASLLAMKRAIMQLSFILKPQLILVDGTHCPPDISIPMQAVIKGDRLIPAISAASILAKVARDTEMRAYHQQYPDYDFDVHKGYPTKRHKILLKKFGLSPIHRKSFRPCNF